MGNTELTEDAQAMIERANTLQDLLAAAFDAFETIRGLARDSEDRDPGLFAAFMATANAAVEGREALTAAPSLPPGPDPATARAGATAGTAIHEVTAALATLGGLLAERLAATAAQAGMPEDRAACARAADAAGLIRGFMAGDGDGRLW